VAHRDSEGEYLKMHEQVIGRHAAIQAKIQYFNSEHLPPDLAEVSRIFEATALRMLELVPVDDPELTLALDSLLLAKDRAVRARLSTR